jgi:hypothetical protein
MGRGAGEHICRTIFVIWNGGSRKITASDIAEDDPIRIGISGVLLDYTLFQPAPGVRVKKTGNVLEIVSKGLVGPGPPGDDDNPHVVGLQVVHDSGAWVPTVNGQIGDIALVGAAFALAVLRMERFVATGPPVVSTSTDVPGATAHAAGCDARPLGVGQAISTAAAIRAWFARRKVSPM